MSVDPPSPKKPGRPTLDETERKTLVFSMRLSQAHYDALVKEADRERLSLAAVARRRLTRGN
jgi:hypothetical protein